jgi:hypothetical protein
MASLKMGMNLIRKLNCGWTTDRWTGQTSTWTDRVITKVCHIFGCVALTLFLEI